MFEFLCRYCGWVHRAVQDARAKADGKRHLLTVHLKEMDLLASRYGQTPQWAAGSQAASSVRREDE